MQVKSGALDEYGPVGLVEYSALNFPEVSEYPRDSRASVSQRDHLWTSRRLWRLEGKIEYHQPGYGQSSSHRWYEVVLARLGKGIPVRWPFHLANAAACSIHGGILSEGE
jgi:hypothetical protein